MKKVIEEATEDKTTDMADEFTVSATEDAPAWEAELDTYPLRNPDEDPHWAVVTVWIWVGTALFSLAFVALFIILGFFYE